MKKSNYTFAEGFLGMPAEKRAAYQMAFDWDKAAQIIKEVFEKHPDLIAEAGLQGDWAHTGGVIFKKGFPTNDEYTYLSSNWAKPTLILSWSGMEMQEIECFTEHSKRFHENTKWDDASLSILGQTLLLVEGNNL